MLESEAWFIENVDVSLSTSETMKSLFVALEELHAASAPIDTSREYRIMRELEALGEKNAGLSMHYGDCLWYFKYYRNGNIMLQRRYNGVDVMAKADVTCVTSIAFVPPLETHE